MDFVAWDIEIKKEVPNLKDIGRVLDVLAEAESDFVSKASLEAAAEYVYQSNWKAFRPLGISCAATLTSDDLLKTWATPRDVELEDGTVQHGYEPQMSVADMQAMADYLANAQRNGYPVVTWNGLQFDFDVLAEEVQDVDYWHKCAQIALDHIDPMFEFFCQQGYPVGLDAMAKGLGLSGKTEGMHGDLAPVYWAQGPEKQAFVLEYVSQDVRTTAQVYAEIINRGKTHWIKSDGMPSKYPWVPRMVGQRLLTCLECLDLSVPDTSWMKPRREYKRLIREDFYAWTAYEYKPEGRYEGRAL